ncbi:MAG: CBS domain-containing protein [Desulfurococcales archaeon]|nr:CBS domain-containing protein [Desulfurococcales archaeon]
MALVKDIMRTELVTLSPGETVESAVRLMKENNIGSILVVDAGKLVGIFTERDLVSMVASGASLEQKLGDVMTRNLVTVKPDDPVVKALCRMIEHNIRHIPVVDDTGAPLGMVSARDILRNML